MGIRIGNTLTVIKVCGKIGNPSIGTIIKVRNQDLWHSFVQEGSGAKIQTLVTLGT